MADHSNPSRPGAQTLSLRRNLAHAVTPRRNTCTATMAKNKPNYSAKSARQPSRPTIVSKDRSRRNTSVHTANMLYSVGKLICTSSPTNAATIIVRIASMLSKDSTRRNGHCLKLNLHSSNSATSIANTYSRPVSCSIPRLLNHSSILERSTIPKTSLA